MALSAFPGRSISLWSTFCPANDKTYSDSSVDKLFTEWQADNNKVDGATRINADSARLEVAHDLSLESTLTLCSGQSVLKSVTATDVVLHLAAQPPFPAADFFTPGPFPKP